MISDYSNYSKHFNNLTQNTYQMSEIIDLTTTIPVEMLAVDTKKENVFPFNGHIGTHFDVMDKAFSLEYMELPGIVFDVHLIHPENEITENDIPIDKISNGMFVAFYAGFIEHTSYGSKEYFKTHPQLSHSLIDKLLSLQTKIIGLDFAGARRGSEHTPVDQKCADQGCFIVENLCNLQSVLKGQSSVTFTAGTYPISITGIPALPCRVIAKPARKD